MSPTSAGLHLQSARFHPHVLSGVFIQHSSLSPLVSLLEIHLYINIIYISVKLSCCNFSKKHLTNKTEFNSFNWLLFNLKQETLVHQLHSRYSVLFSRCSVTSFLMWLLYETRIFRNVLVFCDMFIFLCYKWVDYSLLVFLEYHKTWKFRAECFIVI